ncbi:hypothetical protein O3P69_008479 [Scylla paramamosain]|uniref:Uncharacterized protein n=1 Tax=Scylla paramamosain TaxID=85552 RepID=A0AAW0SKP3_SCYPA
MSSKSEAVKQFLHIMTTKRQIRMHQETGALEEMLVKAITSSMEVSYAHFDVIYCRDQYHGKSVIEPLHSVHK